MNFTQEKEFLFHEFLAGEEIKIKDQNKIKIDLHCHDFNSDVPDELLGRLLNIPETWLPTESLLASLQEQHCDVFTITNHNNARSCFTLQEKGVDVLVAAEFTCYVPDFHTSIHVLTYGFNESQQIMLNRKRGNLYKFMEYCHTHDIPTIWAHPLYYYSKKGTPPMEFFEKLAVVFTRFEVINGQRDTWQNMLSLQWIRNLNEDKINALAKKFKLAPDQYTYLPYQKSLSGGSDSHMGIFAGLTGTYLLLDNLPNIRPDMKQSELALAALKQGQMSPYGAPNENEKMTAAFLDYFCQIAMHMQDPGLIRIMLHKGEAKDKLMGLAITNGFLELRKHKKTITFLRIFHECFQGIIPHSSKKFFVDKDYKNIFELARTIAITRKNSPEKMPEVFRGIIEHMFIDLNDIFFRRLQKKKFHEKFLDSNWLEGNLAAMIQSLELPSVLRKYTTTNKGDKKKGNINLTAILDGLSFPLLSSAIVYGAAYTSTRVLYNNRSLLKSFADHTGILQHPGRMLWLTDTFGDKNGVSMSLKHMLNEIRKNDLPIDLLVCSDSMESGDHLIVIKPFYSFTLPFYNNQEIRIPNILEIHEAFRKGEFDRIMCSTEGIMGIIALVLKSAYSVPANFFVHTDWITFIKKTLNPDPHMINRIRRILRFFYRQFDQIFVLNREQKKWFAGKEMGIPANKIFQTSHWSDPAFHAVSSHPETVFGTNPNEKILLYAGRISHEKGIADLELIYKKVKSAIPETRMVIAGAGPAEGWLKEKIPDAIFTGWISNDKLPELYSSADILLLPSRFDTFGRVILEAMACGLPVAAYNSKGPRDIIQNEKTGFLVASKKEMADKIIQFIKDNRKESFRKNCLERANAYTPDKIMHDLLKNLDLLPENKYQNTQIYSSFIEERNYDNVTNS